MTVAFINWATLSAVFLLAKFTIAVDILSTVVVAEVTKVSHTSVASKTLYPVQFPAEMEPTVQICILNQFITFCTGDISPFKHLVVPLHKFPQRCVSSFNLANSLGMSDVSEHCPLSQQYYQGWARRARGIAAVPNPTQEFHVRLQGPDQGSSPAPVMLMHPASFNLLRLVLALIDTKIFEGHHL